MNRYASIIWHFKGQWNKVESKCGIDIFDGQGDHAGCLVVICRQLNEVVCGVSVTNAAETIATEVLITRAPEWCAHLQLPQNLSPNRVVWIEHYPKGVLNKETWDRVTFDLEAGNFSDKRGLFRFAHPRWKHIDRATVERWIGGAL